MQDGLTDGSRALPIAVLVIHKSRVLGQGAFGIVYEGSHFGKPVAVKCLKPGALYENINGLELDLRVMKHLGKHDNLITLIGHVVQDGVLQLVTEFCACGSLLSYLRAHASVFYSENKDNSKGRMSFLNWFAVLKANSNKPSGHRCLIRWAYQISNGMDFLAHKQVLHCDLATRNVLLTTTLNAKICDFGLSKKLYGNPVYNKTNAKTGLPWRWMPIESLKYLEFSNASDVWAFGITLWEIFTLGDVPYGGMDWTTDFASKLSTGLRLHKPEFADKNMYDIMLKCWSYNPFDRPNFSTLKEKLFALHESSNSINFFHDVLRKPARSEPSVKMMVGRRQRTKLHSVQEQQVRVVPAGVEASGGLHSLESSIFPNQFLNKLRIDEPEPLEAPNLLVPIVPVVHLLQIQETDLDTAGSGEAAEISTAIFQGKMIALKRLKHPAGASGVDYMAQDVKIMTYVGYHPNLLKLIGVIINASIVRAMVLEFCPNGSLERYIRRHREKFMRAFDHTWRTSNGVSHLTYVNIVGDQNENEFSLRRLHQWAYQISLALAYLHEKKVIHGGIALRNILLTEDFTAKVYDFGLSRNLYEYKIYSKKTQQPLPWRWMALESLKYLEFSFKSDVWSYGITLWEMYSFGDVPYGGVNWTTDFCDKLKNGSVTLRRPPHAPMRLYSLMEECWRENSSERPTFEEIQFVIENIVSQGGT